jgi:hypothetical protein
MQERWREADERFSRDFRLSLVVTESDARPSAAGAGSSTASLLEEEEIMLWRP